MSTGYLEKTVEGLEYQLGPLKEELETRDDCHQGNAVGPRLKKDKKNVFMYIASLKGNKKKRKRNKSSKNERRSRKQGAV